MVFGVVLRVSFAGYLPVICGFGAACVENYGISFA